MPSAICHLRKFRFSNFFGNKSQIISHTSDGQWIVVESLDDAILLVDAIQINGAEEFDDIRLGNELNTLNFEIIHLP